MTIDGEDPREALAAATRARLEGIADIPTLPSVLVHVWDLSTREDTSAQKLGLAMSADPGLTGAILRLANSAYFGFPGKVGTVTQAIVVLGFETVKSLAMGASVFRAIRPGPDSGIDPNEFFRHSLMTALGARVGMEKSAPRLAGSAFSAGILHDLGKLVIGEFLPEAAKDLAGRPDDGKSPEEAELDVLGMDHAEIGAWFAGRWSFPEDLTAAVRWHHAPDRAETHREYVAAVHLGDVIAHRIGADGSGRPTPPEPCPAAWTILGSDEGALDELVERARELESEQPVLEVTLGV